MRSFLVFIAIFGLGFFLLSLPKKSLPFDIPEGDAKRGEYLAIAAGCASCHGEDYAGGDALYSPFGIFYAPNITQASYQVSADEFAIALLNGVDQNGKHLYPAFPYSTYETMRAQDVADLYAYISALPAVEKANQPHELKFFARWRRPLGLWKKLRGKHPDDDMRGAYLAETLGHCQECHTPRMPWGTLRYSRAYQGGKIYNQESKVAGSAPNLITGEAASWSASEIESYLSDGFTPEFDSAGGEMVEVIENTSRLSAEDRKALAEYIANLSE